MRVDVDQAGDHELPGGVNHRRRIGSGQVRLDRGDTSARDADIPHANLTIRRIEDPSAFDHQVVLGGR
jgi:hypothetical protein